MISILMQGTNQEFNALGSVFGVFLHLCGAPWGVVDMLAHMGITISCHTVHGAVHSLSLETYKTLQNMGQMLLVAYAYDNFNINFKTHIPTVEAKYHDTLTHLTSGTLIQLEHGVTTKGLKCLEMLWKRSPLNPDAQPSDIPPPWSHEDLEGLHLEADHPSGLTHRQ